MKVNLKLNKDNYVELYYISANGDYTLEELEEMGFDINYPTCCKLEGKTFYINEEKKEELIANEQKLSRIAELEKELHESDIEVTGILDDLTSLNNPLTLVSDLIALLASFNSKYAQLVKDRKAWREELNELKK